MDTPDETIRRIEELDKARCICGEGACCTGQDCSTGR